MNSNKSSSFISTILMMLVLFFMWNFMSQKAAQQKPTIVVKPSLARAQDLEKQAGDDKKKLGGDVINAYRAVAEAEPTSEDAAKARLQIGIIDQTKIGNSDGAVDEYAALLRDYGPRNYPEVAEAKNRLAEIDSRNKTNTTWGGAYLYRIIDSLVNLTGKNPAYSYVLALLIITLAFKFITTPLSHAQFKQMREMQKIQPLVKELQTKYKDDQKALGEKTMALYKEHGVNPFGSCLPLLVQMPFLLLLYKMVRLYKVGFVHGSFLWIGSGATHDLPAFFTVLGKKIPLIAANLALPDLPLLLIYVASMIISQKLTMVSTDPSQIEQQKMMAYMMPIMFGVMFMTFPSAFMLYWLFFNIISTVQQYFIMKPMMGQGNSPDSTSGGGGETVKADLVQTSEQPQTNPGPKAKRRKKKFQAIPLALEPNS